MSDCPPEQYFKELLILYGDHQHNCPARYDGNDRCTCGWEQFPEIIHAQEERADAEYTSDDDDYQVTE